MVQLYLTADRVGDPTGGGLVTYHESEALKSLGETQILSRAQLNGAMLLGHYADPWGWDHAAYFQFGDEVNLAHIYAGTFSDSVRKLKANGAKVTYTSAAHSIEDSRREHEKLGIPFAQLYPHLVNELEWKRYVRGYLESDKLIVPCQRAKQIVMSYGAREEQVAIIPHGVNLPEIVEPLPRGFTVGYMGAIGPDKGLIYLLQAWKQLNYSDATLILAGRDTTSPFMKQMIHTFGGGNIECRGWVEDIADFYADISLYVQPSVTEGFGIEVLEAMSFGRPVICSTGAGACDVLNYGHPSDSHIFSPCNVQELAEKIDTVRNGWDLTRVGLEMRDRARNYTWDKVREQYAQLWRSLL